jgi:hypothetical protein
MLVHLDKYYLTHIELASSDADLDDTLSRPILYPVLLEGEARMGRAIANLDVRPDDFPTPLRMSKEMDGSYF